MSEYVCMYVCTCFHSFNAAILFSGLVFMSVCVYYYSLLVILYHVCMHVHVRVHVYVY